MADKPDPVTVAVTSGGNIVVVALDDGRPFDLKLTAFPQRPPGKRSKDWSWRCRHAGTLLWSGRGSVGHVIDVLTALLTDQPLPDETPSESPLRAVSTVGEMMACWLDHLEAMRTKPNTLAAYRGSANRITSCVSSEPITRGPWLLRDLWEVLERRYKYRTVQVTAGTFIQAWRWARTFGLTDVPAPDPLRIKPPSASRPYTPTVDEIMRAVAAIAQPSRRILMVQLATGARISEVVMIHRGDVVDDEHGMVVELGRYERAAKTGIRMVPIILPAAVDAIREAMEIAGDRAGPIWTNVSGGPVSIHERSRTAARLRRLDWAKLKIERFTSHGIRRHVATKMRRKGVNLETAAQLLGHSIRTMLEIYREIDEAERVLAMEQLHADNVVAIR